MALHFFPLISRCSYCSTVGGPGVVAAIAVILAIALASAAAVCWRVHRQRRRRQVSETYRERRKRWHEAELRHDRMAAAALADEQARQQTLGTNQPRSDAWLGMGGPRGSCLPPPPYEGPAVPLRNLNVDLGTRMEGQNSRFPF